MGKKQFRIGELAKALNVEKYVVRFWEKEFGLTADRSEGGQRFYTSDDLARFKGIKTLLYEQGFTISGARKQMLGKQGLVQPTNTPVKTEEKHETDTIDMATVRQKLLKIKEML